MKADTHTGRMKRLCLFLILVLIPGLALFNEGEGGRFPSLSWRQIAQGEAAAILERYVAGNLPMRRQLQEMGLTISLWGGRQEQNGIFISRNMLMKNVAPGAVNYAESNTRAVLRMAEYAGELGIPVYLSLIPTACAIQQEDLPLVADTFNQRQLIEETYARTYGRVSTVDAYSALLSARSQYLYYRTENNLTAMGGYYVYQALGDRLGISSAPMSQFDLTYAAQDYYGDLYRISPYKRVTPDVITLFHFKGRFGRQYGRRYTVTHFQSGDSWQYGTLYPADLRGGGSGSPMDVYLGGLSAMTQIETGYYDRHLLIFGDETALAYLPMLCNHYGKTTLVDLTQNVEDYWSGINLQEYDQILFAYSVENYTNNNGPSKTAVLAEEK